MSSVMNVHADARNCAAAQEALQDLNVFDRRDSNSHRFREFWGNQTELLPDMSSDHQVTSSRSNLQLRTAYLLTVPRQ